MSLFADKPRVSHIPNGKLICMDKSYNMEVFLSIRNFVYLEFEYLQTFGISLLSLYSECFRSLRILSNETYRLRE